VAAVAGTGDGGWLGAAAWSVDVARLRDTLDRIRAGLDAPMPIHAGGDVSVGDTPAVARSLREILARLDATDFRARDALSGLVREYQPGHQVASLTALVGELQTALRRRVAGVLGERKLALIVKLLASPAPDLLRILGRDDDENSHSDLIAWLLTPHRAPVIAPRALHGLVEKLDSPADWVAKIDRNVAKHLISVRREVVIARALADDTDDLRRIDILISAPDFVLAIENKVWSREHTDQTSAYWEWLAPARSSAPAKGLRGGLLFSPSGLDASCPDFKAVSYLELVSLLLAGPLESAMTPTEEIVLGSYLKTLARRILPIEMRAIREAAAAMEAT
jgi:hypothetical protein